MSDQTRNSHQADAPGDLGGINFRRGEANPDQVPRREGESGTGGPADAVSGTALAPIMNEGESAGETDLGGVFGTGGGTAGGGGETALGMRDTGAGTDLGGGGDMASSTDREQMARSIQQSAQPHPDAPPR